MQPDDVTQPFAARLSYRNMDNPATNHRLATAFSRPDTSSYGGIDIIWVFSSSLWRPARPLAGPGGSIELTHVLASHVFQVRLSDPANAPSSCELIKDPQRWQGDPGHA